MCSEHLDNYRHKILDIYHKVELCECKRFSDSQCCHCNMNTEHGYMCVSLCDLNVNVYGMVLSIFDKTCAKPVK